MHTFMNKEKRVLLEKEKTMAANILIQDSECAAIHRQIREVTLAII